MQNDLIPLITIATLALLTTAYYIMHWRLRPKQTDLDSFDALNKLLGGGKPVLVQFHAPM